jgi:tellurite methyltransferase
MLLVNGREQRARWTARHYGAPVNEQPSPFVVRALAHLGAPQRTVSSSSRPPRALDLACGRGRHALLLARSGYHVEAVDFALPALISLAARARTADLRVDCIAADVTTWPLPRSRYALVVVASFLERALFGALRDAVQPGGVLVMETFLRGQEHGEHPNNPAYLLRPGELALELSNWIVLDAHEGCTERDGRLVMLSGIAARKPAPLSGRGIDMPDAFGSTPAP